MGEQQFRGIDYNKIKEELSELTNEELEEKMFVFALRAQKEHDNDLFLAIEYMAKIAVIGEIGKERGL